MTAVPPEELAARQQLGERYQFSQELTRVQEGIRAHRLAINTLIREERRLLARKAVIENMIKRLQVMAGDAEAN